MLGSITPLGERGRNNRWGLTVSVYLAASMAGGALTGAVAGALGALLYHLARPGPRPVAVTVALVCLLALWLDLWRHGAAIPTVRRQVNEDWLDRYRGWVYGVGFGFQLGTGVMTIVTTAAIYAAFAVVVLSGSIAGGAVLGAFFGAVRALPVLGFGAVRTSAGLREAHLRLQRLAGPSRSATVVVLAAVTLSAGLVAGGVLR